MVKANLHLSYLKKQISTSWLKIKQESQEDPKVLFLSGGPQTLGKLFVSTNAEYGRITDCSLENSKGTLDNMPKQRNWDDQRDSMEGLGFCERRKNRGIKPATFCTTQK